MSTIALGLLAWTGFAFLAAAVLAWAATKLRIDGIQDHFDDMRRQRDWWRRECEAGLKLPPSAEVRRETALRAHPSNRNRR